MTDTPAHTPLPWVIDKYGSVTHGRECVSANGFSMVMSPGDVQNEAKANAAFIVRACNSHYQLVEAAKAIMPTNLNLADWLPDDATIPLDVPVSELRALSAALSQAGGE